MGLIGSAGYARRAARWERTHAKRLAPERRVPLCDRVQLKQLERLSTPVSREPLLAERLANEVGREIAAGAFKPGDRLPTEREMSESYGVSRAIVREAMGRLKHEGMILSRQGSGVFVADGNAPTLRLHIAPSDAQDLRDVVELLTAVRSAASAHAAARRTSAQLTAITHWYEEIGRAILDGQPGEEEDIAFHRAIIDAAGNPLFIQILEFLDARMRHFVRTARTNSRTRGLAGLVQEEHRAMLEAIAAGDPVAARVAAEQHLTNALHRLGLAVERRPTPKGRSEKTR